VIVGQSYARNCDLGSGAVRHEQSNAKSTVSAAVTGDRESVTTHASAVSVPKIPAVPLLLSDTGDWFEGRVCSFGRSCSPAFHGGNSPATLIATRPLVQEVRDLKCRTTTTNMATHQALTHTTH
jgi:hypothetical protein